MSAPDSPQRDGNARLRRTVLFGLLLITATAFFSYGRLPEPGDDPQPSYLERLTFKLAGVDVLREPDVVFVPTPQDAVDRMLALAEIKPGDVLYDLGCGDGRIVATAAKKYGVRAVGVDINPMRVAESRRTVKTNGVSHLAKIILGDIFALDFSDATVVTLYLLPELNARLLPKLNQLKPGSRVISYEFDMAGVIEPHHVENLTLTNHGWQGSVTSHRIFKWTVPLQPEARK